VRIYSIALSSCKVLFENRSSLCDKCSFRIRKVTVSAPKVANVVCAQNLHKRKGAKPILQATVYKLLKSLQNLKVDDFYGDFA
jgi:hypothetical protein